MITFSPKTNTYDSEAKAALSIVKNRLLILTLPSVALVVIGLALAIVLSPYALIVSALFIVYLPIINLVLSKKFFALNKAIKTKYVEAYTPVPDGSYTVLVSDNKNYSVTILNEMNKARANAKKINSQSQDELANNMLYVWKDETNLNFIASSIFDIDSLRLKNTDYERYKIKLSKDFGKMFVPISQIDHYRDNVLVCVDNADISRLAFADCKAFDTLIPQKEYYYTTEKKGAPTI